MKVNQREYALKNGKVRRIEEEFGHSYWHESKGWAAGVTTILSEALPTPLGLKLYWQNMDRAQIERTLERAQEHGSTVHNFIDHLNQGEKIEVGDQPVAVKKDLASYIEWFRTYQPEEVESEQVTFYDDGALMFAGTTDMVFLMNGKRVLLDIKTSNQVGLSAFLQVTAYAQAYEQSYGDTIDELLILQLGTAHKKLNTRTTVLDKPSNGIGWKIYQVDQTKYSWQHFQQVYDTWLMIHDGYPEPPKVVEYPDTFQLLEEL